MIWHDLDKIFLVLCFLVFCVSDLSLRMRNACTFSFTLAIFFCCIPFFNTILGSFGGNFKSRKCYEALRSDPISARSFCSGIFRSMD